jgi:hypothetical protein
MIELVETGRRVLHELDLGGRLGTPDSALV